MFRYLLIFFLLTIYAHPKAIYTPTVVDETSLNVSAPDGWSVKHYNVSAGLKAVFWPIGFNPINADLMIFVFIGNKSAPSKELENMDPFRYKCPGMGMKRIPDTATETENSLHRYFTGRCGRGMALVHIDEGFFSFVILMVSSQYLTTNQMKTLNEIAKFYKAAAIKAMGKDYYMVRDGVNEEIKSQVRPDYIVPKIDPASGRPINRVLPETKTVPAAHMNTNHSDLKTSTILKKSQSKEPISKETISAEETETSTETSPKAVVVNS